MLNTLRAKRVNSNSLLPFPTQSQGYPPHDSWIYHLRWRKEGKCVRYYATILRAIFKRLLQVMLHFPRFCIFAIREGWRISPLSRTTAQVWYTCFKILTWLPDFLVVFLHSVWFSLCSSVLCELRDNGVVKNFQFWLFDLGVMLAF